jgi:hypothetical protein
MKALKSYTAMILQDVGEQTRQHLYEEVDEQVYGTEPKVYERTYQTLESVKVLSSTNSKVIVGFDQDSITPSVGSYTRHVTKNYSVELAYGKHQKASLEPWDGGGLQYILGATSPAQPKALLYGTNEDSGYTHEYPGHEERPVIEDTLAWLTENAATLGTNAIVQSMGVRKDEVTFG